MLSPCCFFLGGVRLAGEGQRIKMSLSELDTDSGRKQLFIVEKLIQNIKIKVQ
jgi:hypothetical protein